MKVSKEAVNINLLEVKAEDLLLLSRSKAVLPENNQKLNMIFLIPVG